jgi:phage protein D
MINNPQPVSTATRPRGMVIVNGEVLQGLVSFEVDNNSFYQADSFRLVMALSAQPANRGFDYWAAQTSLQVELLVGYPQDPGNFTRTDLKSLVTGYVDDIDFNPLRDEITFAGRDLTALMIDTKRSITFTNLKSSDIAAQIASAVGLQTNIAATKAFQGTMNQIVKALVGDRSTYWDILTKLAQIEQFNVWVSSNVLNFQPKQPNAEPYVIQYQSPDAVPYLVGNFTGLTFSRNLSVTRGVKVTVRSFNQKTGQAVTATATRSRVKNATTQGIGSSSLPPAEYVFTFPNMTADMAQAKATTMAQEISQHEVNVSADMPGDDLLTALTPVQVVGTGTAFDQIYYPASVQRRYSLDEGYRMSLRARNYSPETSLQ